MSNQTCMRTWPHMNTHSAHASHAPQTFSAARRPTVQCQPHPTTRGRRLSGSDCCPVAHFTGRGAPRFGGSGAPEPLAAGRVQGPFRAARGVSQPLLLGPSRPCPVSTGKTPHTRMVCHVLGYNLLHLKCAIRVATITAFLLTRLSLRTHQAAEGTFSFPLIIKDLLQHDG